MTYEDIKKLQQQLNQSLQPILTEIQIANNYLTLESPKTYLFPSQYIPTNLYSTIQDSLKQSVPDTSIFKNIAPIIFSNLDIASMNTSLENFYNKIPKNIQLNIDENTVNILEDIETSIEEYNSRPDTTEKIKIPIEQTVTGKNIYYLLTVLLLITTILSNSGIDVKEDIIIPFIKTVSETIE